MEAVLTIDGLESSADSIGEIFVVKARQHLVPKATDNTLGAQNAYCVISLHLQARNKKYLLSLLGKMPTLGDTIKVSIRQ